MSMRKFRALLFRHGVIHQAIEAEQQRPEPDSFRLLKLKRLRLALKDQLRRLSLAMETGEQARLAPARAIQRKPTVIRR